MAGEANTSARAVLTRSEWMDRITRLRLEFGRAIGEVIGYCARCQRTQRLVTYTVRERCREATLCDGCLGLTPRVLDRDDSVCAHLLLCIECGGNGWRNGAVLSSVCQFCAGAGRVWRFH